MKPEDHIEHSKLDSAILDVFQDAPNCGALGNIDDLSRRRMINGILEIAKQQPIRNVDLGTNKQIVYVAALGFAAVVMLSLAGKWLYHSISRYSESETSFHHSYFGEVQRLDGELYFDDKQADMNAPIPVNKPIRTETGTALLRLPTGISWQLEPHSQGTIAPLKTDRLQVNVFSGESWFRVDPTRAGPAFSVNTKMGRIDVTGTIFVVNAKPAEVWITLLKGDVWVTRPSGRRDKIDAGHVLYLNQGTREELAPETKQRMLDKLTELTWQNKTEAIAANAVLNTQDKTDTAQSKVSSKTGTTSRTAGPKQLLQKIQFQRKNRNWEKVAHLYKMLIHLAPNSETAIISRVSLGEVYLTKLRQYKDALSNFDKYLKSGHTALLPEATFGKCRAFRAMGKRDREIQCLDTFVKQFSRAFQAPKARARLESLQNQDRI